MSERNIFIMIFLTILFPIAMICSDIEIFLFVGSLVLIFQGISNVIYTIKDIKSKKNDEEEKIKLQIEEESYKISKSVGFDIKKFGSTIIIAKNIMIINYLICAIYFLYSRWFKTVGIILIAYYVYDIINKFDINNKPQTNKTNQKRDYIHKTYYILHNLLVAYFTFNIIYYKLSI